jgi:hypothetical protein
MKKKEQFDGVAGGRNLPESRINEDVVEVSDLILSSEVDRRMARLLALHPTLRVRFRNRNLATLDDQTKEALIEDMYYVLGVAPLK